MRTDKPPYATNETAEMLAEPMVETQKRGCEYWVDWDYPYDGPCDGTQCDLCIELEEWLASQRDEEENTVQPVHPPIWRELVEGEEE